MASSIPGFGLVEASLCFLEAEPSHPSQAQQASFLPAQHFGNLLFSARLHTTASFSRELSVRVCTTLIYILTRCKSTALSAIIITHLLKGSAQSLPHLRRAAAGSCPSAPSKHTSGTAWYPNSFSTHLKPLHSNGVMAAQWSGGASAAQQRLDIIFSGVAAAASAAGERRQGVFDSCRRPHTRHSWTATQTHTHNAAAKQQRTVTHTILEGVFMLCGSPDFVVRVYKNPSRKQRRPFFNHTTSTIHGFRNLSVFTKCNPITGNNQIIG